MLGPSTECVWGCGRSDFTAEHVVGRGFANRLELPYPLAIVMGQHYRVQRKLEIVVRDRVCDTCNRNWMKRLDDRMRFIMGGSITDAAPVGLTQDQQKRVARWAFKVALLLMLWLHDQAAQQPELLEVARRADAWREGEPYIPTDDFAYVGRHHTPPAHVRIWLGRASESASPVFVSASALSRPLHPSPERVGYYVLFGLRHLAVYVLAGTAGHGDVFAQGLGKFVNPENFAPELLLPVWPTTAQRRNWPPPNQLSAAAMEKLTATRVPWSKDKAPPTVEPEGA